MLRGHLLSILFAAAIATQAVAQDDMRYFVGTWNFSIWAPGNTRDKADLTGMWHVDNGLDSALALVGRVVLNDGPNAQGGVFTRELITYDAHLKMYTRTIVTNAGSHYAFTSHGWHGDKLTWIGRQHAETGAVELREEIERTGPDSFDAVFYRKDGEEWLVQSREELERMKP